MQFNEWMNRVEQWLSLIGLSSSDLPDIAYADLFEDDTPAREAARMAYQEANS
jgi:hypothetical protein